MDVDSTKPSQSPKRCYTLSIEIGADTFDEAVAELERLTDHVGEHGPDCALVTGGPASGASVLIVHRPEMTHDRYFQEIEQWLSAPKNQ